MATFSRGKAPTGSQDPFALRRQALSVEAGNSAFDALTAAAKLEL